MLSTQKIFTERKKQRMLQQQNLSMEKKKITIPKVINSEKHILKKLSMEANSMLIVM